MVMRKLREHTKWIMLLTALAFVGLMVFEWGMDASGRSSAAASGGEIGRVNGESISYEEFLTRYRALYEQQQQQRDEPISTAENREIEEAAWDQVVMDRLIRQELRRRGIRVTPAEIREAARFAPPPEVFQSELFQADGQFDLERYHQYLAQATRDPEFLAQLEGYYREIIPRGKLYQQVVSGAYLSDTELWRLWRDRRETVRVRFAAFDPQRLVPDEAITIEPREIRSYYDRNRAAFAQPARAIVRVATMSREPSAADTALAREHALELRRQITEGGQSFAEVAERESADPGSGARGGDLGTIRRGQTVPQFEQAVWAQALNRIGEPVQSQFGYHLIRVDARSADTARVHHILVPIRMTEESEDRLLARADSLEALTERLTLEEAARQLGLRVREAELVDEAPFLPGTGRVGDGLDWALEEAVPGEVSPVFDDNAEAYYILELMERRPARTLSLEEATPDIRARLLDQKKLERVRVLAREVVDRVRAGQSLEQAAQQRGATVQEAGPFTRMDYVPGLGQVNAAIGAAFGLPVGRVSGAIEADGGIFVLEVLERTEANREEFEPQRELFRMQLGQILEQQRWEEFLRGLREEADIRDNRREILRPAALAGARFF
jgi:peptidyl-prolyl cis-trans isomerase D